MIFGISHVELAVTNLARARRLYVDTLGLLVKKEGEGFVDLEAGTVLVRLFETSRVEHRVAMRLQVGDVPLAWQTLVDAGARPLYEPLRTPQLEVVGSVADPDGHSLTVWRPLSEDEYGFLPELPKAGEWHGEAEALLKSLLTGVPSLFRGLARRKVVAEAEALSVGRAVGKEDVIRAYIRANAKITRYRVKKPLEAHGIDCARYQADFDA
jgi:catechol 2,3-dioxygenase-like lactoylglutathione lyase family enzyme